jgi:uncharacterized protein RhaS with RHS repeats
MQPRKEEAMYDPRTGRWLSEDPIGFAAADANLYRYVGNSPTNATDPAGLYDDDVHFYMTYYIGLALGLGGVKSDLKREGIKQVSAAFVIAWADNYTDFNPQTEPGANEERNRRFHFRTSGKVIEKPGEDEAKDVAVAAMKAKDLLLLGIGLHPYQDSWSHEKYGPARGHLFAPGGVHNPDDPSRDVAKAMKMAKATYDLLEEFRKTHYKDVEGKLNWDKIKTKIEREFVKGEEEQKLSYAQQVAARVKRWRQLIEDDFKVKDSFGYLKKDEPWAKDFLKAADTVKVPAKK